MQRSAADCSNISSDFSKPSFQLRKDTWKDGWLLILAAFSLGIAIQIRDGLYDKWAFVALTIAVVAALAIYVAPSCPSLEKLRGRPLRWLLACGIAINFALLLLSKRPGSWHGPMITPMFRVWVGVAALSAVMIFCLPRFAKVFLLVAVAAFLVNGAWIIRQVPRPYMDVWMLQTEGVKAFTHGNNPFGTPFPDIYHRPELYGPGAIHADGLVHLGFPYPPMVFWMDWIGYVIGGDYRWMNLAAMALAAMLIGFADSSCRVRTADRSAPPPHDTVREADPTGANSTSTLAPQPERRQGEGSSPFPGATVCTQTVSFPTHPANTPPLTSFAALLFLFTPRVYFVLESGWTEPVTALLLVATLFFATRRSIFMPVFLGLFLCSKQYLIWAIPPILLLAGRPTNVPKLIRITAIALISGCTVSLPLILWNLKAYLSANVSVAQGATVRSDALSYIALLTNTTGWHVSTTAVTIIGCGLAAFATLLVCLRGARSVAGYAAAVGTAHLIFFSFYKFAFCNYDWFLIAAFCAAVAVLNPTASDEPGRP
jgi:hypothetical protein